MFLRGKIYSFLFITMYSNLVQANGWCTYQTYTWNTNLKQATNKVTVKKPYSELTENEIDRMTGCTVCEEDQRVVNLAQIKPFKLCHVIVDRTVPVLQGLVEQGAPVLSIVGYRVGMTRGETDAQGNRTKFSNHSFGIALDLNTEQNGLYDNCLEFNASCRLLRGGHWMPGKHGVLTKDSAIVKALKNIGFKWGGEIKGRQKDFMHFSPSGY